MSVVKYVVQLQNGDIVCNDVYANNVLLVKAGTEVNELVVSMLEKWKVKKILVARTLEEYIEHKNRAVVTKKKESLLFSSQMIDMKKLFLESLGYVVNESRYGFALHNDKQIQWLEQLFLSAISDSRISNALLALKKIDSYSFYHSFDVFLLGALLGDISGVRDIKTFVTGCLIHDIGKIKIPQHILQKEDTLSTEEFELIKSHTIEGLKWLNGKKLPSLFEQMIRSHHERLDGSGYPDGLTEEMLSAEVRILSIVDMYSALTLQKPYREPMSSTKAVELLLKKKNKFDYRYLINFIELLNIYPTDSIVSLSNGKMARVKAVNENQPYRPVLEELDRSKTFELPTNFSVTIPRFVQWDQVIEWDNSTPSDDSEQNWNEYISNLINGNQEIAITTFKKLTAGMTVENIFIDVIVKSIKTIDAKRESGELSLGEEHDALLGIKDIFDVTLHRMEENKNGESY